MSQNLLRVWTVCVRWAQPLAWAVFGVVLFLVLAYALARPIDLASADLGRHLENGRQATAWLFRDGPTQFLRENTYSYTAPTFPVPNHHWASGILLWGLYVLWGFTGLSVLYIMCVLAGVGAALALATRIAGIRASVLVLPLVLPLIAYRDEVRPEVFSFVFVLLAALLCLWLARVSKRQLWLPLLVLVCMQALWVNMHIYFILGPAVTAAFFVDAAWRKNARMLRVYGLVFLAQIGVSVLNPNGLWGVWYPFTILQNYGYRVLENQTIWFLWDYGIHTAAFWVFGLLLALVVAVGMVVVVHRRVVPVWAVCLALGGVALGLFAVRNLALAAVLLLPLLAWSVRMLLDAAARRRYSVAPLWLLGGVTGIAVLLFALYPTERVASHALGVAPGALGLGAFLRAANVQGPVFNNYDVGGLLIFTGYPQVRVFVDNRPEAYPETFFSEVYIPMQERASVFAEVDAQYQFRAIVFNYHDATPWAQTFLQRTLQDAQWVPVYVDGSVLVLLRDVPEHAAAIAQYALPRELFRFTAPQ